MMCGGDEQVTEFSPSNPTPTHPSTSTSIIQHPEPRGQKSSDEQLDALADGLAADGAGLERGTAVDAGGVSALEDQLDVVVDADWAGDPLLHLTVARLQLLQQVVLLRVLVARTAVHLCLVCVCLGGEVGGEAGVTLSVGNNNCWLWLVRLLRSHSFCVQQKLYHDLTEEF